MEGVEGVSLFKKNMLDHLLSKYSLSTKCQVSYYRWSKIYINEDKNPKAQKVYQAGKWSRR